MIRRMKTSHRRRARGRRRGVTLVEVLVVIAIMSILTAVVAFAVVPMYRESQKKTARLSAASLRRLAGTWKLNHSGEECPDFAGLRKEKLIDQESSATDPWGSPYVINCVDDDIVVVSAGPDKKTGTADDITAPGAAPTAKGDEAVR